MVYQAYRPEIGVFAAEHGHFGGAFSYSRMSWIKPNFLWMMYRSGWGTKAGQEITLALELRRDYFTGILAQAVASSFDSQEHVSHDVWRRQLRTSDVRLQWDPDRTPTGQRLERRAIQLGLRRRALGGFRGPALHAVHDISEFVAEQRELVNARRYEALLTPSERLFQPEDPDIAANIGLDRPGGSEGV